MTVKQFLEEISISVLPPLALCVCISFYPVHNSEHTAPGMEMFSVYQSNVSLSGDHHIISIRGGLVLVYRLTLWY